MDDAGTPVALPVRVGVAGWSLPAASRDAFAPGAHQLARYASRLDAVEINSSFYRAHARATYARWAALVPARFRFSVKLPPNLDFDPAVAERFFAALRARAGARVGLACEPRHPGWAQPAADALWKRHRVSRVAADPPRFPGNAVPGGAGPPYLRLHGASRIYRDAYTPAQLRAIAAEVAGRRGAWVVFDNTAGGHAVANALALRALLGRGAA